MEEKQGLLRELRPHATWKAVEWTGEKIAKTLAEAGLIAFGVGFVAWLKNHLDLVTVVSGFVISLVVLICANRRKSETKPPGDLLPERIYRNATEAMPPVGLIGDFVNIQFEKARYGSDAINAEAMDGLNAALEDRANYTSDGAVSIGIGDKLVGRDVHPEVQKFLRITLSAELHGGKALTIRPRDRIVQRPTAGPLEIEGSRKTVTGNIVEGFFDWGRFESSLQGGSVTSDFTATLHVQLINVTKDILSLMDCSLVVVFQHKTFSAIRQRIIIPQPYCIERPVPFHTSHEGISRKAFENIPNLAFPVTLAPAIPAFGLLQFFYPDREKVNNDNFQDAGSFTLTFTDSIGHLHEVSREIGEWPKTGKLIPKPLDPMIGLGRA